MIREVDVNVGNALFVVATWSLGYTWLIAAYVVRWLADDFKQIWRDLPVLSGIRNIGADCGP